MRLKAPQHVHVVKKEEKETKLREFIEKDLAARAALPAPAQAMGYALIARSIESPVVKALSALGARLAEQAVTLRVVVVNLTESEGSRLDLATALDVRHARDQRLIEAHEQLVLSSTMAWIGDCMRRDPDKRDAFECYSIDSAETAMWAATSFERIWATAEPVALAPRRNHCEAHPNPELGEAMAAIAPAGETDSPVLAATRH